MTADQLRDSFREFFAAKDHSVVPSASLIPHDPTVLFTVAGMVPFKSYFVGDEVAPFRRAVSSQKCARAGGKHNDLDDVGRTKRHLVFFEMMGNFSFGDYFKEQAIPWSWDLVTEGWGFDGDRMWITVHDSDDEAEAIWHEQVGVPLERIQRLGDKDNFWQMGDTGPCGPCSEIHIDRGPAFGPDGGPLGDPEGDRFMEFWNLVFMQYNQAPDGSRTPLPRPSIDTGAGLERILALLQGVDSVWETDLMQPLIDTACSLTGKSYRVGDYDDRDSFAMRVLAEHARSSTMLVSDGVFPSNEGRGYVLRRILRRAIRYAYLLGTEQLVMPRLAETAIDVMGNAYPDVIKNRDFILSVLTKEEERFRHTLRTGLTILDGELGDETRYAVGSDRVPAARHVRLPARAHPGDRRRARHPGRRRGVRDRDGGATGPGQGGPQGGRRRRPRRRLPRGRRAVRRHRVPRVRRRHHREPGARRHRRARRQWADQRPSE